MQGRLSPPIEGKIQAFPMKTWRKEFRSAKECGFDLIDWIIETRDLEKNPLMNGSGLAEIKRLGEETGVKVGAVCADYFMEYPLIRCSEEERKERLEKVLLFARRLSAAGIPYMEFPLVDNSAIQTEDELRQLIEMFSPIMDKLQSLNVTIAFETSLPPERLKNFFEKLNHPVAKANYDMGNSASLGYKPKDELLAYGKYVVTVHVKDRIRGGGTVPLGTGDTDFDTCFAMLAKIEYKGPYILQAARGEEEISWNKKNKDFVLNYLSKYD
jgi:L-ribulose-5-phosphate 3-epimerase